MGRRTKRVRSISSEGYMIRLASIPFDCYEENWISDDVVELVKTDCTKPMVKMKMSKRAVVYVKKKGVYVASVYPDRVILKLLSSESPYTIVDKVYFPVRPASVKFDDNELTIRYTRVDYNVDKKLNWSSFRIKLHHPTVVVKDEGMIKFLKKEDYERVKSKILEYLNRKGLTGVVVP